MKLMTLELGLGLRSSEMIFVSSSQPSQVKVPYPGFDRQAVKFHLGQGGCSKDRDDIAARHRALKPVELSGADDDNGIFPVERDSLRPALLRLPDHLAEAGFRVLKPPSPGPGARAISHGAFFGCGHGSISF
jgi:hypothetical protein